MTENSAAVLADACGQLSGQTLPRWRELPDLDLYMDQVLALIDRYLSAYPGFDRKGLTSSMVNNYVKLGVMPPPVRKKYTRSHLAHLIVICVLKPCLPIASIQQILSCELAATTEEVFYDRFCGMFEQTGQAVAQAAESHLQRDDGGALPPAIYYAALRAQAEQALATRLLTALFPPEERPERAKQEKPRG